MSSNTSQSDPSEGAVSGQPEPTDTGQEPRTAESPTDLLGTSANVVEDNLNITLGGHQTFTNVEAEPANNVPSSGMSSDTSQSDPSEGAVSGQTEPTDTGQEPRTAESPTDFQGTSANVAEENLEVPLKSSQRFSNVVEAGFRSGSSSSARNVSRWNCTDADYVLEQNPDDLEETPLSGPARNQVNGTM